MGSVSRWLACSLLILIPLTGCGGKNSGGGSGGKAQDPQAGPHGHAMAAGGEKRPAQPPIPVAVEPARTGGIASYYEATATLEAENDAEVLARVSGVVLSLACEEGDWMARGAELLRIEDQEYALKLAQSRARTANLTARHDRLKKMWSEKLVSAEEFEAARNDLESAKAEEGLAGLNLSYTRVTAPFAGRVTRRMVNVGQNVSAGTPLFRVSDFDPLLARVHVPAKEFRRLQPDQPVELVLDSTKERLSGRIKLVSPIVDPASGTVKVTIEIGSYPPGVRPGDFAQVRIVTEERLRATLVPRIAVLSDKGEQVVYVAGDSAERRVVEVGFQDDRHAEILSGMKSGELVVVKGQRSLKHGSPVKILADSLSVPASPEIAGS